MAHSPSFLPANDAEKLRWAIATLGLKFNQYIPHIPTGKQLAFLLLRQEEAFYGGAAGGGKSDALLLAALQYVDVPGYNALILRRTFAQLSKPESIMQRAKEWLAPYTASGEVHWSEKNHQFTFPSGATLSFGYLDHDNDIYNYQGPAYAFIGFDELTQFREHWYTYLFSRSRKLRDLAAECVTPYGELLAKGTSRGTIETGIPLRVRSASNPGGIGHEWVKQRFIVEGRKYGRPFVPAKMEDNPYLDQRSYHRQLSKLDPVTRAQLESGDWDIQIGDMFQKHWFPVVMEAPAGLHVIRFWDLAGTKKNKSCYTAGAKLGVDFKTGRYYLLDMVRFKGTPLEVERVIQQTAMRDGRSVPIYFEQEPGASSFFAIDHFQRQVLMGFTVLAYAPGQDKVTRAQPVSSAAQAGNFLLLAGEWIGEWLSEACAFPNGDYKDQVDAVSGAVTVFAHMALPRVRRL